MASLNQTTLFQDIEVLQPLVATNYCLIASAAIIFYEYILTLSDEVSLVWSGHLTITNVLFVANRYFILSLGFANVMESLYWSSSQGCEATTMLTRCANVAVQAVTAGISALRVYAIGGHRMILPTFVLAFGLVPAICNIYLMTRMSGMFILYIVNVPLCATNVLASQTLQNRLIFVSRLCPIASDMIVLVVTWVNTYKIARQARSAKGTAPLAVFLLRDGTLYFSSLLALNILEIVLALAVQIDEGEAYVYISTFLSPISSILLTRFVLNLRRVPTTTVDSQEITHSTASQAESMVFASRIVGNMDADLDFNQDADTDAVDNTEEGWDLEPVEDDSRAEVLE